MALRGVLREDYIWWFTISVISDDSKALWDRVWLCTDIEWGVRAWRPAPYSYGGEVCELVIARFHGSSTLTTRSSIP